MENFKENFVCPVCKSELSKSEGFLACFSCKKQYKVINGIYDFREQDEYWSNVSREKMQELNQLARKTDWLSASKKILGSYAEHFAPFYRADSQFLWPTDENSVILDAGSMWGGVSIPAAQYHKEVLAIDKTQETLEFLDIRAKQMGFANIHPVAASIKKLPFPDNFFDLAILSGVLEWVGVEENITLEEQWQRTGRGIKIFQKKRYAKTPREMQLEVLTEIKRVLKPNGSLFLAIENSVGFIYLVGWPDEHMNLPFLSFLPRFISNFITKVFLGSEYRTYVYNIPVYRKLLEKAGFLKQAFYGVFNHYINAKEIVSIGLIRGLKKKIFEGKIWQLRLISKIIPSWLLAYLSPSIMAIAFKNENVNYEPRIKKLFREAELITGECPDFKAVKWDSRLTNGLPVNYLVYADDTKIPTYFCKIARDKNEIDSVKNEAENLKKLQSFLKGTSLESHIPQFVFYGTIGQITFLVTKYLKGREATFSIWNYFKNQNNIPFLSKYATKRWLKEIDGPVKKALSFIDDFQKITKTDTIDSKSLAILSHIKSEKLPLALEHGDYDLCNILIHRQNEVNIIDFEHLAEKKLPFLDLGNLLFNYLIFQYKDLKPNMTLIKFADEYGWTKKLREWLLYYSQISGISMDILKFLPALAVREQNARVYPKYRNPYTYPMYGEDIIKEMSQWIL